MKISKEKARAGYVKRMNRIIDHLGGRCVKCGSSDRLQIDHVDPEMKEFDVSHMCGSRWVVLVAELKKCQLLCYSHHREKTTQEQTTAKGTHGTLSSYRYCHCEICRAAKNEYMKKWKKENGHTGQSTPKTGLVHGTKNAYSYYKCRCDVCREGNRLAHIAYRERKLGT